MKKIIKQKDLTQEGFAQLMGISRAQVTNYLNRYELKGKTLDKICDVLRIDKKIFLPEGEKNSFMEVQPPYPTSSQSSKELVEKVKSLEEKILLLEAALKDKEKIIELLQKDKAQ
ncbi:MAG TPA: helix-turn-helix transcriptional regulator [Cytophagaceae bacterium]